MSGSAPALPLIQFTNALGLAVSSGTLTTYLAGSSTLATTYQDEDMLVENTNPIQLDSSGQATIYLDRSKKYKFLLKNALGATISGYPVDDISPSGVRDVVSVDDYPGTETVKLQAAIDAMEARGGGTVYVPATGSTRALTATITNDSAGVLIDGAGKWNTRYTRSTDYGDTFFFTGNDATGARLVHCGISNLSITSTGLTTSGAHIHTNGCTRFNQTGLYIQDGFIGMQHDGLTAATIDDLYCVFTSLYGGSATGRRYMEFGSAAATYAHVMSGDVFVSNFNLRGNTTFQITEYGLNIVSGDGIWFSNGHVGNASSANIRISAESTDLLNLLFFTGVMSDEGANVSLSFEGSASTGRSIKFANCEFKGGTICQYGLLTSATAAFYGVQFVGCTFIEFDRHGIDIESPNFNKWRFTGCEVFGNSKSGSALYPGIRLADGVTMGTFDGGASGYDNGAAADPPFQSYGLSVGAVTNIIVSDMDLTGNVTGSIFAPASLSTFRVANIISQDAATAASASTLTLPYEHDFVNVTGTTGITNISPQSAGRRVSLKFADVLTVTDGGNLRMAGNFVTTADDVLTLVCDGAGNWYETGRSVN